MLLSVSLQENGVEDPRAKERWMPENEGFAAILHRCWLRSCSEGIFGLQEGSDVPVDLLWYSNLVNVFSLHGPTEKSQSP